MPFVLLQWSIVRCLLHALESYLPSIDYSLFTVHCSLFLRARNIHSSLVDGHFEELERLGRRAADVGAGVSVINPAMAGAVDAVGLRLILHRASQMRANRCHRNPAAILVVNQQRRRGAEFEHKNCAERQLLRILEGHFGDRRGFHRHLLGRGQVTVDGIGERGGEAQPRHARRGQKSTAGVLFAWTLGDCLNMSFGIRLFDHRNLFTASYAAPSMVFRARATPEMSQPITPSPATKRTRNRPTTHQFVSTARSQTL